jgi:hypothetical protein
MWLIAKQGFLSIVAHRDQPDAFLVRARVKEDLEAFGLDAQHTPTADYPYRATISRQRLDEVLQQAAESIDYPNFKATISDPVRHEAYMGVWSTLRRIQK